ncbi:MAG TPA: T9SS type A sorting domain-containing protein, partial [Candidatus Kapabacteria bacterium]|nr:T9SS type A sorting domain-containing protein [Candidatus Kapabacteria bacterium]
NALITNYPNPFSSTTNIELQMPIEKPGTLKVYDMLGREVADLTSQLKGQSTILFNSIGLQPGMYFCKGVFGAQSFTSKLVVVK